MQPPIRLDAPLCLAQGALRGVKLVRYGLCSGSREGMCADHSTQDSKLWTSIQIAR